LQFNAGVGVGVDVDADAAVQKLGIGDRCCFSFRKGRLIVDTLKF